MSNSTLLCWNVKKLNLQFRWFWRQNCTMSWCAYPCVTKQRILIAFSTGCETRLSVRSLAEPLCRNRGGLFGFGLGWVCGLFICLFGWFLFGVLLLIRWGFLCLLRKSAISECNSVHWEIDLNEQYLLHFELEICCKAYFNWCASTEVFMSMEHND